MVADELRGVSGARKPGFNNVCTAVGRSVVGDDNLEVSRGLATQGIEGFLHITGMIVAGNEYTDARSGGHECRTLIRCATGCYGHCRIV